MSESTPESGTTGSSGGHSTDSAGQSDVVVITGATSGIGRATARKFGEDGARVGLLARGEDGLDGTKADIETAGGEALAIPTDVSNHEEVEAAAGEVEDEFGPIDIWINDAMTTVYSSFLDLDPEEFERITDVTYIGAVNGSRAALSRMTERDEGKLVQVGSALSYRGIPLQSAYCGSKFAMRGMNESLRAELLADDSDVDITMVQLPGLNTPQFEHCRSHLEDYPQPVPPMYQPEVAADGIHWAAYNDRRELYIGRATLKTIWGNKFVPWFVDRYLAWTAVDGQKADLPYDPDRPENLHEPVDGDPGARGPFNDQATNVSQQLWLAKHRHHLGVALSMIVGLLALVGVAGSGEDGTED